MNNNLGNVQKSHRLDAPIRAINKYVTVGAFLSGILGVCYGFFFRDIRAFQPPLLILFFTTAILGSVWALLVAVREMSVGMRTKVTSGIVWMTIFWGSFGIVGLVFTTIMIRSLVR